LDGVKPNPLRGLAQGRDAELLAGQRREWHQSGRPGDAGDDEPVEVVLGKGAGRLTCWPPRRISITSAPSYSISVRTASRTSACSAATTVLDAALRAAVIA
jgi:hypothetical protein